MLSIRLIQDQDLMKVTEILNDLENQIGARDIELESSDLNTVVLKDSQIVGIVTFSKFTAISYLAHCAIAKQYQNKLSLKIGDLAISWIKEYNIHLKKILVTIPEFCRHSQRYVKLLGFKECARIAQSIIYKDRCQNLNIYELDVR